MAKIQLTQADAEFSKILEVFDSELKKLRSGRANPDLIKEVKVEAYGQMMPLEQVSNINVVDATLLSVQPWDKTIMQEVERAIRAADLGLNPSVDSDIIRVPIPSLTEERRKEYVKILKQKSEEARIRVRQLRKEILDSIEEQKDSGDISEDEFDRYEKELQSKVDEFNNKIDEMTKAKEESLMTV